MWWDAIPRMMVHAKDMTPDEALARLRAGNRRFLAGEAEHPNANADRLALAGRANQGDHAYATVLTCSDSRVPTELIFDAGVMDIFSIRVAGNVCNTDEIGSIEYGICHVHTPVTVVLGHTQCGAVTTMTRALQGAETRLECNIPALVESVETAVRRAMAAHPELSGDALIPRAIEENLWLAVERLFLRSPAVRDAVRRGKAKVVGAMYDVGTGEVAWLPEEKALEVLNAAEQNPERATEPFA